MSSPAAPPIPPEVLHPRTRADRERRDRLIYQTKVLRSLTYARVSEMFGLSERRLKSIVAEYREREQLWTMDVEMARHIIAENLAVYEDTLEQASLLATKADNDSARIGALNLRMRVVESRTGMLQEMGVLPKDLGQFTVRMDMEEAAGRLVEVFRRFGVSKEVQDAAVEAMLGKAPPLAIPSKAGDGDEPVDAEVVE